MNNEPNATQPLPFFNRVKILESNFNSEAMLESASSCVSMLESAFTSAEEVLTDL